MKTIAFNRSNRSLITTLFVVGGLTGLYFYRRGSLDVSGLVSRVTDWFSRANITDASGIKVGDHYMNREIPTSNVDLDRMPST